MKILIVCPKLNHGGAERVAVCLANGFFLVGHEVTMASNLIEEVTYELNPQIQVFNLVGKSKRPLFKWLSAIRILRSYIKTNKPDVIIGIMQLCSFVAKLAATGKHIPVIMTEHDSFERPLSAPFTWMQYFCKYYLNKIYTHVTVLTSADKVLVHKTLKHVTVMPNPLAIPTVTESETNDVLNKKENIILASGRLYDWHYKGLDVLIKAWANVVSILKCQISSEGWMLEIAGYGDEKDIEFLKDLAKEYGVGNRIRFLGFCKDVVPLYRRSEIFVLSSRYEGFGLVLIEAMSQGCACVACDYKGRQREILCPEWQESSTISVDTLKAAKSSSMELERGTTETCNLKLETNLKPEAIPLQGVEVCENGILCEPDNVEALAKSIKIMIENKEYRKKVQANAIERSKYYSIDNTLDRWEEYLKKIVN